MKTSLTVIASTACAALLLGTVPVAQAASVSGHATAQHGITSHVVPPTTTTTTTTTGTTTTGTTTTTPTTTAPTTGGRPTGPGCGPGGQRGPGGSQAGHPSLLTGTISSIDTAKGTITLTAANGKTVTVAVTSTTALVSHETIAAGDVALGDRLCVQGIPLALAVTKATDTGAPAETATAASTPGSGTSESGAFFHEIRLVGTVTTLVPLTITVADTYPIALTISSDTTLSKVSTLTLAQLTTGVTVHIQASTKADGTVTATLVDISPAAAV